MTGDEAAEPEAGAEEATLATVVPLPLPRSAPVEPAARPNQRTSSSVLMAAMLGLADAMGFERPRTELVTMAEAHSGEDGDALILGFGPLDPLD